MDTSGSQHSYTWNADSWTSGLDFTCFSPWNSYFPSAPGDKGGTLISPRQFIFTKHFPFVVGNNIDFVTADGQTVSRSVVAVTNVANTDLAIGLLDSDVPSGVMPASVLPADYASYFPTDGTQIPVVRMAAAKTAGVWHSTFAETTGATSAGMYTALDFTHPDSTLFPDRAAFSNTAVNGDSGSPCFIVLNGETVLVSLVTSGSDAMFNGPMVSAYIDGIDQAMHDQDVAYSLDTSTYQLRVLDLSGMGYQMPSQLTNASTTSTSLNTYTQTSTSTPTVDSYQLASGCVVLAGSDLSNVADVVFWVHSGGSWSAVSAEDTTIDAM